MSSLSVRIFQLADRLQQPLDDILLIENGQLHRDSRQVFKMRGGFGGAIFSVLVVEINQDVAMHSIPGQQDEHDEIRDEQRHIEGVGVV